MRRLHNQHQRNGSGGVSDNDVQENGAGSGQKRTRRRRRTKRPANAGSAPVRTAPRPNQYSGKTAPQTRSEGFCTSNQVEHSGARAKHHDAPMERRDLHLALICGMVATGTNGEKMAAGRVTVVNWDNQIVLDTFVKVPPEEVFDYRTEATGITAELLAMTSALHFKSARAIVGNLIRGKILIGHGLEVDLGALNLVHPWCDMRDTTTYTPYMRQFCDGQSTYMIPREMEDLMIHVFSHGLNQDQPSLVREAVGCMELYRNAREAWEEHLRSAMQRKLQQREMIMNMRLNGAPQLSSINEDGSLAGSAKLVGRNLAPSDIFDYDNSTFTTVASTADQIDDSSEASSFLTQDTDNGQNPLYRMRTGELSTTYIDNISDLGIPEDEHEGCLPPGIWSHKTPPATANWDRETPDLSFSSVTFPLRSKDMPDSGGSLQNTNTLSISEEELLPTNLLADIEEEGEISTTRKLPRDYGYEGTEYGLREAPENTQPSLAQDFTDYEYEVDYDYEYDETDRGYETLSEKHQLDARSAEERSLPERDMELAKPRNQPEEKKKGWFGIVRRPHRRCSAGGSISGNERSQRDAVQLSSSDRTHRDSRNLLANEQWLDADVSPSRFSRRRRNSLSNSSPSPKPRSL